jgi:hypothetical protein
MLVSNFSFWSFPWGFKDGHLSWCLSCIHDCSFRKMSQSIYTNTYFSSPFNNDVTMQIFGVCRFCYLLLNLLLCSKVLSTSWSRLSPWWISCFHLDPNRIVSSAFQTCTFYEIVELPSLNPTRHPLVKTLAICRSSESFWNWSQYSSFLLNPLKFDGIASPHFCVAPYHMHHECTIA